MSNGGKIGLAVVAVVVVICLCLSVLCIGAAGVLVYQQSRSPEPIRMPTIEPFPTLEPFEPETPEPRETPTPFSSEPADPLAEDTLNALEQEIVPINDAVDLAARLLGKTNIPATVEPPAQPFQVGDSKSFWVTNSDTAQQRQVNATLRYLNDVVSFWIEDGVVYDQSELKRLADTFAEKMYPTNREFFGSEWSPGIDGDPRLYVLYATDIGSSVAGYFSSADSTHPEAFQYSNAHEMFVLSADNVTLDEDYTYSVMAHEFQHMIHYNLDRNEESWVNEGFSELAVLLNDYSTGGFDSVYLSDPDIQLNTWESPGSGDSTPHYGSAFLYMTYFLGRFGEQATKALVANPANGMDSVDAVLQELGIKDDNGQALTADQVFADWTVSNYLDEGTIPGNRYSYPLYKQAPKAGPTETISDCPAVDESRDVTQYGVDYIRLTCPGDFTLDFEGALQVPLLPAEPYSGDFAFWSNQGDESDMTLTREFDFSAVSGPINLRYRTWYDIETDYDYVYVLASTDGATWKMLRTPSGTDTNPSGANYGWGYTGPSDGWIEEEVDLTEYAGKKVQVRFEYITDAAVNGRGLLLDDIAVEAVNYASDFESDEGGWQGDGFVRVANTLPQTFQVSLIRIGKQTTVESLRLDADQRGSARVRIGGDVDEVIIVVSGTTRFTTERAGYRFSIR